MAASVRYTIGARDVENRLRAPPGVRMPRDSFLRGRVRRERLDRDPDVCCVIDISGKIIYCNPAWDVFAAVNGGGAEALAQHVEGRLLLDFVPEVLRNFYASRLLPTRYAANLWKHSYECSSPDRFRIYSLQALSVSQETLACHSIIFEGAHTRPTLAADAAVYTDPAGSIQMCGHCRRVRRMADTGVWDWVPDYLRQPLSNKIDVLCPDCWRYHYGDNMSPPWFTRVDIGSR